MSEQQQGKPEPPETESGVEALIEENPEEVARFLERLDLVNDLLDATSVATSAMDDEMVQSLAGTGTNLGLAANEMATDETVHLGQAVGQNADALAEGVQTIAELQQTGTLDDLVELATIASLLTGAMDDEMVQSLAGMGTQLGGLADRAADEDVTRTLDATITAVGEAAEGEPEPVGMLGMARAIRDPDVQVGLGFVIALSKALGQQLQERHVDE